MKFWDTNKELEKEQPKTVCYRCKHFWNIADHPHYKDIWYSHKCLASPVKNPINPVTGKPTYNKEEDKYNFCRDVND